MNTNEITRRIKFLYYFKDGADEKLKSCFSRQTLYHWLNGNRLPSAEAVCEICKMTGVSADWLLGIVPANYQEFFGENGGKI